MKFSESGENRARALVLAFLCLSAAGPASHPPATAGEPEGAAAIWYSWGSPAATETPASSPRILTIHVRANASLKSASLRWRDDTAARMKAVRAHGAARLKGIGVAELSDMTRGERASLEFEVHTIAGGRGVATFWIDSVDEDGRPRREAIGIPLGPGVGPVQRHGAMEFPSAPGPRAP